nr:hypothetical protein [Tanacetum cinerariifolium]
MKRLNDLKAEQEKSKQVLKKLFNPATLKAQSQKWTEHEAKNAKRMQEYKRQISFRADTLPISKISYVVNFKKEATIKITRGDNPLNLVVHPNFRLKTLGLSPPPELATFGLTAEKKKRKRTELIKEVFVTKNVRVDGMDRNLISPPRIMPIQGIVINEPESGTFFMNMNTNIGFQRESEFHLTNQGGLKDCYGDVLKDELLATVDVTKSLEASELAEEQGNQPSATETKKSDTERLKTFDVDFENSKLCWIIPFMHESQPLYELYSLRLREPEKIVEMEEDAEDQSMEIPTVEQLLDEVDKQNKALQETPESPYDTESKIKVVKSCFISQILKLQDQIMHDSDESADYESMPEDDMRSVSKAADSDDEVSSLHSKLGTMEYSFIHQVSDGIESTLSALVTTTIQEQLSGLLSAKLKDCLPSIIQESLQTHIPASSKQFAEKQTKLNKKVVKHLNRQFNIFHVAQSDKFARLETKLSKTLKSDMEKSVTTLVKSCMKEVRDDLKSKANSLEKLCLDIQSMQTQLNNIQSRLESAVIVDDTAEGEKNKKDNDSNPAATQGEPQSAEPLVESQGEQPTDLNVVNKELALSASNAKLNEGKELVVPNSEEKKSKGIILVEDDSDKDDKEPTPPKDSSKGKAFAIIEEPRNELVKYQEEGGSGPKMPNLKSFITPEGHLSHEEYNNQIREIKRLNDLKAEQEKSKHELRKLFNPSTLKARAQKLSEHEAKKAKMMQEYKHQISFKADTLPITNISYVINSRKEATMKIIRGNNPLNLVVHLNFRLKTLGLSEWLEAKRLGLPPPHELATFGLTAEEKKKKRNELIKEVFVTENVKVDRMDRNLIPPLGIMPIQGLVINEPESGIFFMNGNTDIGFQREKIRPSVEEPLSAELRGEERPAECKASAGSERTL